jgi:hypothetical protein
VKYGTVEGVLHGAFSWEWVVAGYEQKMAAKCYWQPSTLMNKNKGY